MSENAVRRINESLGRLDAAALNVLAGLESMDAIYDFLREQGYLGVSREEFRKAVEDSLREDGMTPGDMEKFARANSAAIVDGEEVYQA